MYSTLPRLLCSTVHVQGTGPIARIEVIKNNAFAHTVRPESASASFEFRDNDIKGGESYYYVRVEQTAGQLAWSSPIWVKYSRFKLTVRKRPPNVNASRVLFALTQLELLLSPPDLWADPVRAERLRPAAETEPGGSSRAEGARPTKLCR